MSVWWSVVLLVAWRVVVVNTKVDLDSPIRLAHCRAFCLHQVHATVKSDEECQTSFNCSQCWTICDKLQKSHIFCQQQQRCGASCQAACAFPALFPGPEAVLLAPHEDLLQLREGVVSWHPQETSVFAVLAHPLGLITQTVGTRTMLPSSADPCTVRVLVMDPHGLQRVLSLPQQSPAVQALQIARSVGFDNVETNTRETLVTSTIQVKGSKRLWRLHEVSRIYQETLVLVQISWQPQNTKVYLVTWEEGGGVLRGNLLTDSTMVTLSLWPHTLYRIQVALFNASYDGSSSEPLMLDTHSPAPDPAPVGVRLLVVGLPSAVAVFLLLTLLLTWRWHHRLSLPLTKLVDEDVGTPNLYRVFPPVSMLLAGSPDEFSSTDNLLRAVSSCK